MIDWIKNKKNSLFFLWEYLWSHNIEIVGEFLFNKTCLIWIPLYLLKAMNIMWINYETLYKEAIFPLKFLDLYILQFVIWSISCISHSLSYLCVAQVPKPTFTFSCSDLVLYLYLNCHWLSPPESPYLYARMECSIILPTLQNLNHKSCASIIILETIVCQGLLI